MSISQSVNQLFVWVSLSLEVRLWLTFNLSEYWTKSTFLRSLTSHASGTNDDLCGYVAFHVESVDNEHWICMNWTLEFKESDSL